MNSSKKQTILVLCVVAVILAGIIITLIISPRNEKIPPNPQGTVGNTAGNLNNGGFFCESGGKVYFSNSYDNGALYSMDSNEGNLQKLNNTKSRNILSGGDYLYYFQTGASGDSGLGAVRIPASLNRCRKDGSNIKTLTRDVVVTGQLVGDYLYLLANGEEHPSLKKMKTDKSDEAIIADYIVNPACAVGELIYYNGTQNDHYLYALNTSDDSSYTVWAGNIWYPIVDGNYVYYMDVANNYRLCRYSLTADVIEVLANERVECFNVGNGIIYYQTNGKDPQLIWMYADGSNKTVLAEGIYTNINMTSQYVYFQEYNDDTSLYHSYLGSSTYDAFYSANSAAQSSN